MAETATKALVWKKPRAGPYTYHRTVNIGSFIDPRTKRVRREALTDFQADLAKKYLGEAQAAGAFPKETKQYFTKVDFKPRKNKSNAEYDVKLDGQIRYIRRGSTQADDWTAAMKEMIRLIMRRVPWAAKGSSLNGDKRSTVPFRTRHYKASFAMMRNNQMVVGPGPRFLSRAQRYIDKFGSSLTDSETLAVTNIQPYARRIEEGAHFRKPWATGAPRGVFKRARQEGLRSRKTSALYISQVEYGPLPGGIKDAEYASQGHVTYAEGRNRGIGRGKKAFVHSGRIMRKHRVYPILYFGPPRETSSYGMNQNTGRWTGRANHYEVLGDAPGQATIASQIRRAGGIVGNLSGRL